MHCRLLAILCMVSILVLSAAPSLYAQNYGSCANTVCGPGYVATPQMNGECLCVAQDCKDLDGCVQPPKAVEDCNSIEGCNPPQIIKP